MEQELQKHTNPLKSVKVRKPLAGYPKNLPKVDICLVNAVGFHRNIAQPGAVVFTTSLYEIDRILDERISQDNLEYQELIESKLLAQYKDLNDVFSKSASDILPPHRSYDHQIELEASRESLSFSPLRQQSTEELLATKKYITEHLRKGFIRPSQAPFAALILFVQKADGSL